MRLEPQQQANNNGHLVGPVSAADINAEDFNIMVVLHSAMKMPVFFSLKVTLDMSQYRISSLKLDGKCLGFNSDSYNAHTGLISN